jgi:CheY-like chemotaxis protein
LNLTEHDSAPRRPGRVLVVDDDPDCRSALESLLVCEGYEVTSAANGLEAMAVLGVMGEPPDAMVLDLMMPVMNGWEVLEALKARANLRILPIVVTSASHDPRKDGWDVKFLRKPVDVDALLHALETCVATAAPLAQSAP